MDKQEKASNRKSWADSAREKTEVVPMKSFASFASALPVQRPKLFRKKAQPPQPVEIPAAVVTPPMNRISPDFIEGSDANLLSSPNDGAVGRQARRARHGSSAALKRNHRHRRQRDWSGSDGDRRTVVLRRKRSRHHQASGVNAPPRHVHCNDWREMVTLTESAPTPKSEGELEEVVRRGATSATASVRSLKATVMPSTTGSDPQKALERVERIARVRNTSGGSSVQHAWIEQTFCKRECGVFVASSRDPNKCGCGRVHNAHSTSVLSVYNGFEPSNHYWEKWSISKHTLILPTDSYGTIEFQGGPHPFKAQYLRLNFDSEPSDIMSLFTHVWQLPPPKLIITVHGGITNFDLQPKLARVFRKGLLKAARTTGAWIFTTGINAGVVRHVAAALEGAISSSKSRSKIVTVGIAPWGLLRKREDLVGRDKVVMYHPHSFPPKGRLAVLNNRSSFFLLVDNGTVGRYGADIILRRRLESYIAEKQKIDSGGRSVPVVCVVLEGGTCTVRTVLDYVTRIPKVPVVVCDGSGRASDLLAFAHQCIQEDGNLPEGVGPQLLRLIEAVFSYDKANAQCLVLDILACVRQKNLITIFRLGENQKQDVDYAILTALLKGQNLSPAEQLSLALAWNRVDIARSDIFVMGQNWPKSALHNAMLEALIHNRVDFVRLLLENGVSMHDFLTIGRLEELYNTDQGPPNTLYYIVRDVVKIRPGYRYKLVHIGMAVEKLMANGFRSHYTSTEFRHRYMSYRNKYKEVMRRKRELSSQQSNAARDDCSVFSHEPLTPTVPSIPHNNSSLHVENEAPHVLPAISGSRALSNHILWRSAYRRDNFVNQGTLMGPNHLQKKETVIDVEDELFHGMEENLRDFKYPFSDLLIWAVLTKRHDMALCMWQHGEEAMAKALVACRLYKSLAKEAAEDYLEVEICEELKKYAEEFRLLSLDLLDHCYKQDDAQTLQLLTYELSYWGYETCLSLSVIVNNKQFLAHPCCQILLADLWHGGLRIRSNSNLKVIMGLLFPPSIFLLEFKSREELMLQPQTAAEHEQDINYSSSSSSSGSSSSSSSSSDSEWDNELSSGGSELSRRRHQLGASGGGGKVDVEAGAGDRRRGSNTSIQSLNLANLFHSKRRKHRGHGANPPISAPVVIGDRPPDLILTGQLESVNATAATTAGDDKQRRHHHRSHRNGLLSPGGAMALSATNIISAVSTPIATLPITPIGRLVSKQDVKSAPTVERLDAGSGEQPTGTTVERPSSSSSGVIVKDRRTEQEHQQQEFGAEKAFSTPIPPRHGPSFFVGANEEEDDKSTKAQSSTHGKTTPSPSLINRPYVTAATINGSMPPADKDVGVLGGHFGKKPSIFLPKGIPLPTSLAFPRKRQIKFRRKVYEFFVAPITTFWAWMLSFVIFLVALTYVLLIRTPVNPTLVEWYLLAYVITFGMETIRKFLMSEPKKFKEKAAYLFANYWNLITSVAIIGFLIGFGFRVYPPTRKSVGRVILAVDSVLWSLKLLDFLGVHSRFGPYITMAAKMVMNMSSMIVMLLISLLAFGLVRQSITYPDEEWNWLLVRNIFYKPYFMLYGEVYADEIDVCGDEGSKQHSYYFAPVPSFSRRDILVSRQKAGPGATLSTRTRFETAWDQHLENYTPINSSSSGDACVPGHWIPPLLMTVFLLIGNILLISMLIAIFNNIFDQTIKISQQIWLFQRYRQVMEYKGTPFLPPPFTLVYHMFMFAKYLRWRRCCCFSRRSLFCLFRRFALCCCCCCVRPVRLAADAQKTAGGRSAIRQGAHTTRSSSVPQRPAGSRSLCKRADNNPALFDFSLKLFLNDDQVEKLHDFEEECMEDMARDKEIEKARSNEERLHRTAERTDLILIRLNDLMSKKTHLKSSVRELETRIETMESKQVEILDCMRQITTALPTIVQSLQNLSTQQPLGQQLDIGSGGGLAPSASSSQLQKSASVVQASVSQTPQYLPQPILMNRGLRSAMASSAPGVSTGCVDSIATSGTANELLLCRKTSDSSQNTTTFYVPTQTANGDGEQVLRGRSRTTTLGAATDTSLQTAQSQSRLFGSLASLNPNASQLTASSFQNRRKFDGSIRRRRRHDEYTSITDAIDIDHIVLNASAFSVASSSIAAVGCRDYGDDDDEEEEEDGHGENGARRSAGRRKVTSSEQITVATVDFDDVEFPATEDDADVEEDEDEEVDEEEEEDVDDVENDEVDDEEEEPDAYEMKISSAVFTLKAVPESSGASVRLAAAAGEKPALHIAESVPADLRHRSNSNRHRVIPNSSFPRPAAIVDDGDDEDLVGGEEADELAHRLELERVDLEDDEERSVVHRAGTPNTILQRARPSFIRHQKDMFKNYEEEVGHSQR